MGIRARNASDRLRTIWTPEMDRYFIDLMLEQVGKGNRFDDHLFSKRAWKHMTSLFNARFKFQYEKDVLKNRHKTLRNLYKAVKNLLDQGGFSWDEKRRMVTADNNIWDDYIKVHPDARSFRIKSIPYYSDLCTIYGNATSEQKGNNVPELILHTIENGTNSATQPTDTSEVAAVALPEILIDEDYGISISEKVDDDTSTLPNISGTTMGSRSRTYWQPPMDRYFIDLMLEQVQKGNRVDSVFSKQAWMEMIASFNTKFGFDYGMDILKNRYKTLRRQYNVIKNLLDLDGFAWDDTRQMVIADDYVWQDYIKNEIDESFCKMDLSIYSNDKGKQIKTHTDARQFMTRPVPYYKDLCVICDPNADERDCFLGLELKNEVDQVKVGRVSNTSQSPAASVSNEDQVGDGQEESTHTDQKNKRLLENWSDSGHLKKSRHRDESMVSALREMASAVSSLSDKKKDDENSNSIPIENVIEAVQALPDMDEDFVLDACDFLEDEKKAKTFLALDFKLRKKWLVRKLRPQQL